MTSILADKAKEARVLLAILKQGWLDKKIFNQDKDKQNHTYMKGCADSILLNPGWTTILIQVQNIINLDVTLNHGNYTTSKTTTPSSIYHLMEELEGFVDIVLLIKD